MSDLTLSNVRKVFSHTVAVRDLCLEVAAGELVVLVGPSGCGKSTTLRLIAGLEIPTAGEVLIDAKPVTRLSPKQRDVAMVFQSYALYPHLTARANMAFPLKMRKTPKDEIDRRVRETSELLGITPILDRKPAQLSGGEQQRVALARAIIRKPRIFLLDEPLSNLDAQRRVATRADLKALHKRLGITTIHVTHDQEEAMVLADRLAVMHEGSIQQIGKPVDIYARPANRFVASFIGSPTMNLIDGRLGKKDNKLHFESTHAEGIRLCLDHPRFRPLQRLDGREVTLGIRAGDLRPTDADSTHSLTLDIESIEPLGDRMDLRGRRGNDSLVVRVPYDAKASAGERVRFEVDMERVHLFESGAFGKDLLDNPET